MSVSHMKTADWSTVVLSLRYKLSDSSLHSRLHPRFEMRVARIGANGVMLQNHAPA